MTPQRVCFLYLDGLAPGGYPRDMRWLAGAMAERGIDVTILARPGPQSDGLQPSQVLTDQDSWAEAARRADVLHAFGFSEPAQLRALMALKRKVPAVVVSPLVHLMVEHVRVRAWKKRPAYLIAGQALRKVTGHFFSEIERAESKKYFHPPRSFIAGAGLFPTDASTNGAAGDYLLFFGRNDVHQKGLDRLIAGYALAAANGLELPLLIGGRGDPDNLQVLRAAIARSGLEGRITLVGAPDDAERDKLMSEARAFVFLSRWDGPPRPIREAIATGVPVIVSRGTNMGAIVAGSGAGMEAGESPDEIAAALLSASDEQLVARWRNGIEGLQEELRWSNIALQYLSGYEQAAS